MLEDPKHPRIGITGEPGMQLEVAVTKERGHAVITVLGGRNMAAAGFRQDNLIEHIAACERALAELQRVHGRQTG